MDDEVNKSWGKIMAKNILEFKHVGKRYDDNVVLRDIDFEVDEG